MRKFLRRVYLDLTGRPPSPEETQAFLADGSPGVFAKLVDRLLASPHYGEHWGRHWLDVVRYADTGGFSSASRPGMCRERRNQKQLHLSQKSGACNVTGAASPCGK
jgi:hypothetical protein